VRRETGPEHHEVQRRVRLLMVSGAVGRSHSGNVLISDEQARKLEGLPTRFQTTLVVKNWGPRKDLTCALPAGIRPAWISTYPTKWRLLTPKRLLALKGEVDAADVFLTFVPTLDGLAPLVLALLGRKPRYILMIASPIHFRRTASGGRATSLLVKALLNICALIATRVLVTGKALATDLLPPLRRKVTSVVLSSLSERDILPPREADPEDVRLLCVSRLVRSKRVDIVIAATRLLVDWGVNAHLAIVGDGPLKGELLQQVDALGLHDRVRFGGWIGDREALRAFYASAHLLLSASEAEGISLAVMEAMAAGVPVISTAAGGLSDFLVDGQDSIVVAPHPTAFAAAVQRVFEDPAAYMALANRAQRKVSNLTNEAWVREFHSLVMKDLR
jgi:glycosyltransferase involved in cell wall biosynthesis